MSDDLSDYIEFVAVTTGLNQKPTADEILGAAPSTPRRLVAPEILPKGKHLAGVSREEVDRAVEGLVALLWGLVFEDTANFSSRPLGGKLVPRARRRRERRRVLNFGE